MSAAAPGEPGCLRTPAAMHHPSWGLTQAVCGLRLRDALPRPSLAIVHLTGAAQIRRRGRSVSNASASPTMRDAPWWSCELQPDCRGPRYQHRYGCPDPPATGGRRLRGRPGSQALASLGQTAHLRRGLGSETDCLGLFSTAQGPQAVDVAVAGGGRRGTEHRRARQRQYDRAHAKKTRSVRQAKLARSSR